MKNYQQEAKIALKKLRGKKSHQEIDPEYDYILLGQVNAGAGSLSIKQLILDRSLRKPLIIGAFLLLTQQVGNFFKNLFQSGRDKP